jgi:hypothetical protein
MRPAKEWPHHFIHTLEGIPTNWYVDQELHKGTTNWTLLQQNFTFTFSFEHEKSNIDSTLKYIIGVIFIQEPEVELITIEQTNNERTIVMLPCVRTRTR